MIGGGPAGAAAASVLASSGREVLLLERNRAPAQKVCGDFLSAGAARQLAALGVYPDALGAERIGFFRLVHGDRVACTALPFPAFGLSRSVLAEALLRGAEAHGVRVERGRAARAIRTAEVEAEGLGALQADALFLATGKHEVRGTWRAAPPGDLIGFKMHWTLAPAELAELRSHVEVVLFRGGYAGLQPIEDRRATLCLLVSRSRFAHEGRTWEGLLGAWMEESPHLARRLPGAKPCLGRPLAIAGVPFGFLHRTKAGDPPQLFRLGDQAGVIASLAGDGVAMALHTGRLAASLHLAGQDGVAYHRELRTRLRRPVRLAQVAHWFCREKAQPWVVRACQAAPWAMRLTAAWTRVPSRK